MRTLACNQRRFSGWIRRELPADIAVVGRLLEYPRIGPVQVVEEDHLGVLDELVVDTGGGEEEEQGQYEISHELQEYSKKTLIWGLLKIVIQGFLVLFGKD